MINRNERFAKLQNEGFDTKKYFNIPVPNGLKPGSTISVIIDENGNPRISNNMISNNGNLNNNFMNIRNQIIEDGYVRNTKLHRRFVMAQMFRLLNYDGMYSDHEKYGYTEALNVFYGFDYTMKMMLEEIHVLAHLQRVDTESFKERSHFFTIDVVIKTVEHYKRMLTKYVNNLKIHRCKGVPYKKIKGMNVFVEDLNKKIYYPIDKCINNLKNINVTQKYVSYIKIYNILYALMKFDYIAMDYHTKKCPEWVDAFKGEGAYYTLKNLFMYHNCFICENDHNYYDINAMNILSNKLEIYSGQGWRMLGLMKKVIKDNHFDFQKRMNEVYKEKTNNY